METQEELAKAWAKGQPGFGLYLGCRAVRRAGGKGASWGQTGRSDAGEGDLTVVTVENVVDGMARVCEEGGTTLGAPIDTLVLFKLAAPSDIKKSQPIKSHGNAVKSKILTGGHVGGADRTKDETNNQSDFLKQGPIIPMLSSMDLQEDDENEEESRFGVDWKPGVGTSSGNNWYDCMKFVAPIPTADSLSSRQCPSVDANFEASECPDLGRPIHAEKSTQGPLFQPGGTNNHIRRAAGRSRRTRREAQESRRRVDSPTMEEMDSPTKKEGSEEVRHLLEQLKVARETEGQGGVEDGGNNRVGGVSIALEKDQMKVEEIVDMEESKLNALEGGPFVMNTNGELGVFNAEHAEPREIIDKGSEMEGPVQVEATGETEGEFEAQVSDDEEDGTNEASASRIEDVNQEARLLESSTALKTDQGEYLPTSLPTVASVSRWVGGDQLHKVDSEETWLPASLPQEGSFTCMCWHVDWDGLLTVSTTTQQEGLGVISKVLEAKFRGSEASPTDLLQGWKKGDRCIANFHLDGGWYRGVVTRVKTHHMVDRDQAKAYVQFVDYGSTSWVDVTKLRRGPCMDDLPIQSIRLRMKDLIPMNLVSWDKQALDLLHATLVDRHLRVEVVGEIKNPLDAIIFIGDIDIGRMLVANGFARRG